MELKVTPDRVLLHCEPQPGHEVENAHGFMMHILDDKKTVLTVTQFNILDKEECFDGLRKIGKILKTGKIVYVGGVGDLTKLKAQNHRQYTFPGFGAFPSNSQSLKFVVIANDRGLCYDAQDGDKGPCPREPFSFKTLPSHSLRLPHNPLEEQNKNSSSRKGFHLVGEEKAQSG